MYNISFTDILKCFSDALDLLNPSLKNHHKNTAFIAQKIATEMGMNGKDLLDVTAAAAVHDIGACVLDDRTLTFDTNLDTLDHHSLAGFMFLNETKMFENLSTIVRFHHSKWNNGSGTKKRDIHIPLSSYIVHLADRIDILIDKDSFILHQIDDIIYIISENSGKYFNSEVVNAFKSVASKKSFWLDLKSDSLWDIIIQNINSEINNKINFNVCEIISYIKLLVKLIDFKSNFTATHSTGVAAVAKTISKIIGFSENSQRDIMITGFLHDLGKLSIPVEILEKPDKLTSKEFELMLSHPYYTFKILENIKDFSQINLWASQHHERLQGNGYPFNNSGDEIPLESRIIAVADIFTALSEGRPYRKGMSTDAS